MGKKKPRLPLPLIDKLYLRDGGRCWICGEWGPVVVFNRDHLIPRSLGGTDGMWNLRLCHVDCNARRGRIPAPLDLVLQYCPTPGAIQRAKVMYYKAYPYLKEGTDTKMVKGRVLPRVTLKTVTAGPKGHRRYPSQACGLCNAWCGTCNCCWCRAGDHDHDVLKIRRPEVAVGVPAPS